MTFRTAAAVIAEACLLAGCGGAADPDQARLCRIAAVALAAGDRVGTASETTLPATAAEPGGVRIELRTSAPDLGWIECRFAGKARVGPLDLASVRTPAGPVSEPRLFALERYWLATAEAAAADPALNDRARLPVLPARLAYGLQQALNALPNAAVYGLLAAAYSLVYGLFGRINLAFGELAAVGGFGAVAGAALSGDAPAPVALALAALLGVWAATFHGAVVERLVGWPLRRATGQQGLVATIGVALFLQEYLRLTQGSRPKWIAAIWSSPMALARAGAFVVTVTPVALVLAATAAACSASVLAAMRWSRFGRDWRATADDAGAAALFGVDPRRLSLQTFALASALVGLGGAGVTVLYGGLGFLYTTTLGLKALIAAIVGGIGSVPGAFLGGLGIALVEAAWSAYLPIDDRDLVIDVTLIAVLVFRPGGFFGYRDLSPRRV